MFYSKGFSFIEVVLVLGLCSILILIFMQNISFSKKFLNVNPQEIFLNKESYFVSRGLRETSNYIYQDLPNSIGKRDCSIDSLEKINNINVPNYKYLNHGTVLSILSLEKDLILGMNSATSSEPDIVILDNKNWQVLSTLNTGPGISSMVLQGHYLYLANTSVNGQFQVVDISDPKSPYIVSSLKIPGSSSLNSKLNPITTSISSNILPNNKARIFIGTQKSDLGEIFIADFDGGNLSFVGTYNTGAIVNDVFANESGLWATSPSDEEFLHYDKGGIKDYTFNADGQSGNGKRIDILNPDLKILGRTFGRDELVQIDGPSKKIGGTINDLLVNTDSKGGIQVLIIANISGSSIFQVWNTTQGKLDSLIKSVVLPVNANRMVCGENSIYIGTASTSMPIILLN